MAKTKTKATHYEHIEEMSAEFAEFHRGDFMDGGDICGARFRWWQLRILLAIAQQLTVISNTLKFDRGLD